MTSDGLSPDQVRRLYHGLRLKVAYFRTLTGRLHQTHCPRDDPLFLHARAAAEHMEKLFAHVEELARKTGAKLW